MGIHTKRGSGLIVMVSEYQDLGFGFNELTPHKGVGGGAWYPPAQAALADSTTTRHSYLVPLSGYLVMTIYSM